MSMWDFFGLSEPASVPFESEDRKTKHTALDDKLQNRETMEDEALECDYERECTPLYKNIEEENWTSISKFLETGYWPGSFFADTIPPHDQVRTWVTRFDAKTSTLRWSQLPLHLAIVVKAPYEVIGSLIELYPQAVRCTDDQHMLPLHLAMRHGSSDSVVDLLLAAFPEAVNAKGKNDRTPIDCAIRGPNKVRGRILGTFVERTKAKATKSITNSYTRELAILRDQLEEKESELGDVKSRLGALDTAKATLEFELKAYHMTQQEANEEHILAKINSLEAEKAKAQEEEQSLIEDLESIKKLLSQPTSLDETKEEVEKLKAQISEKIHETDGEKREELRAMKAEVDDLHRVATFGSADMDDAELLAEVDRMRGELKDIEDTTNNKVAIALLKEEIESLIQESSNLSETQIIQARQSLASVKLSELEGKPNDVLVSIKQDLETLKREVKEKRLADKTSEDLVRLRQKAFDLSPLIKDFKTKQDLGAVVRILNSVKIGELSAMEDSELIKINKDIRAAGKQLADIEELVGMRQELSDLRRVLEAETKSTVRKSKAESDVIYSALKKLQGTKIHSKTKFELVAMKNEMEYVQSNLKLKQRNQQFKNDVSHFKFVLSNYIQRIQSRSIDEVMPEAMDELFTIQFSLSELENNTNYKNMEEIDVHLAEIDEWKKRVKGIERQGVIKAELIGMRKLFEDAVANGRATLDMEEIVTKLAKEELAKATESNLTDLKVEATRAKADLKEKESVFKDLDQINRTINQLIEKKVGRQREDLLTLRSTVAAIDLNEIDSNNEKLWDAMKEEIFLLKKELENVDIADKTKKDLATLKEALGAAITDSEEDTRKGLSALESAVEAINTSNLDANKRKEWQALKEEIDSLKKELKIMECESLMKNIQERIKSRNGLSRVELSRIKGRFSTIDTDFAKSTAYELGETKKELQCIVAEFPKDDEIVRCRQRFKKESPVMNISKEETKKGKPKTKRPQFLKRLASRRPFRRFAPRITSRKASKVSSEETHTSNSNPKMEEAPETVTQNQDGILATEEEQRSAEAEQRRTNVPRDVEFSEEKKDDDIIPSFTSSIPLGKTSVPTSECSSKNQQMPMKIPMKRTNSKTVEADGKEVEAVVVE